MQHRAIRLMASKLAVATTIEGNISDEGLSAMNECSDMTSMLARELTLGIEHQVDDIAAIYKKMAIQKPVGSVDDMADTDDIIVIFDEDLSKFIEIPMSSAFSKKNKKISVTGQLSLFDILPKSA